MLKLVTIFAAIFLAELGDKTQIAVLLFSTERAHSPLVVFIGASAALVVATGVAVVVGTIAGRYLEMVPLKLIAGLGFLAIGAWTLFEYARGA